MSSGHRFAFLGQFFEQLLKIGTIAKRIEVGFGLESLKLQKTTRNGSPESRHGAGAVNLCRRRSAGLSLASSSGAATSGPAPIKETQAARLMAS